MAKTLVLAEKPSVGRELARVLGCKKGGNGFLAGDKYIVTWALGHLVTLADPEAYGEQYKTWSMDTLPMLPQKMQLVVIKETAKQYGVVKKLLHSPEVGSLVIATDAGREGELVARWIIEKAGFRGPIKRLWISSQTDKAIREGFAHLRDGKEYQNLYRSAQARAEADWLVGLNVTRALTCKFNAQLSAGRVQTPTLALLVRREEDIRKFVSKEFFTVRASLGKFFATYHDAKGQTALFDRARAEEIASKIKGKPFRVVDLKATDKRVPPPMLYDLTELQRDASRLYGFSPKQTLSYMQTLYERHKALTYPRTDSRYLTDDIVPTLPERLRAIQLGDYAAPVQKALAEKRQITRACVNNAKVTDHHAIIPTEERVSLMSFSSEERKIYDLVVRRFLACFYPACESRSVRLELEAAGERFSAAGQEMVRPGWRALWDARLDEDEETDEADTVQSLPPLHKGDTLSCTTVQLRPGRTKPPKRYTEATLLTAMENPGAYVDDKRMRGYLGGGLGTPATRADIIDKLYASFYVEKQGQSMVPTSKGMQLIKIVPPDLKEPALTAQWEMRLDSIRRGQEQKERFLSEIRTYASQLVKTVGESDAKYVHDNLTTNVCPQCGKYLLSVNGKRGKMLVCQDRACGYRESVSIRTNVRCPQCHKTMEMRGDGEKKTYYCTCGYRERVERFHEQSGGSKASKQFVRDYLKKQNQQEKDALSPFALAMQKAKEQKK